MLLKFLCCHSWHQYVFIQAIVLSGNFQGKSLMNLLTPLLPSLLYICMVKPIAINQQPILIKGSVKFQCWLGPLQTRWQFLVVKGITSAVVIRVGVDFICAHSQKAWGVRDGLWCKHFSDLCYLGYQIFPFYIIATEHFWFPIFSHSFPSTCCVITYRYPEAYVGSKN